MRIMAKHFHLVVLVAGCCLFLGLLRPLAAWAHCDTLDGPVVLAAKVALSKGDITPVLKWVPKGDEAELRAAFGQTLIVRGKGKEAQELADRHFFETLVRLHRAGEGAPYTGLKPAGTDPGPAVKEADLALNTGSVAPLVKWLTQEVAAGIHKRFAAAAEKKKHAEESVDAGRDFVKAYVEFVHYVERLYLDALGGAVHHCPAAGAPETKPSQERKHH